MTYDYRSAAYENKPWTIEVQNPDGTWEQLAKGRAWRYTTEERAYRDIQSDRMQRWLEGARARPALIK